MSGSKKRNLKLKDLLDKDNSEGREFILCQESYKRTLNSLKSRDIIRVGFYIVYDSVFSFEKLFLMMQEDRKFEPFIVVIPDVIHGEENLKIQMEKTYKVLKEKYKNVFYSFDKNSDKYIDFSNRVDLVCIDNPYDCLTEEFYRIEYLAKQEIPSFYTSYGYSTSNWHSQLDMKEYRLLWKHFVLTGIEKEMMESRITKCSNTKVFGYTKMDSLYEKEIKTRSRLKIIVAPHHTIEEGVINYSTFLKYAEFWLQLPGKYSDIDFVFRPHPLLRAQLINNIEWNIEKVDKYFKEMDSITNVEYQNGGDYLETFMNSDAIIHDCGSFMAEYLYTGKPACYLLKDVDHNKNNYNKFAQMCIEQHYAAYNEDDIYSFIDNVVLNKRDDMKENREKFYEENLKYDYPNVTSKILDYLKKEIKNPMV